MPDEPYYDPETGKHDPFREPSRQSRGGAGLLIVPLVVVSALSGVGAGWMLRQAPDPHGPTLREQAVELVKEGCIPVTLVDTFGTAEQRDEVLAHAKSQAHLYAEQFPDVVNAQGRVVDLPEGGIVQERYPDARVIGIVQLDRCIT